MDHSTCSRPVQCAQEWIERIVQPGDVVVDATAGNGHDSLFLARLIGREGTLHAFDIQQRAIDSTRLLLSSNGYLGENTILHCASHARMAELVASSVKAVMFNLGYLPGGDRSVISQVAETLPAIEQALSLTVVGGIVAVVCYPGHKGGDEEACAVTNFLRGLDAGKWRVAELSHGNAPSAAPFLMAAFRLK